MVLCTLVTESISSSRDYSDINVNVLFEICHGATRTRS